jgi:hypothetical protein
MAGKDKGQKIVKGKRFVRSEEKLEEWSETVRI